MAGINDQLNALSQKPIHIKLAVLGGAILATVLVYYQLAYGDMTDERDQAQLKNKTLLEENKTLVERQKKLEELIRQRDGLQETLRKNRVALPSEAELPAFFVHLQKQAAASGITIKKWTRAKESTVGGYVKVPVSMTVTGTFYQINDYFKLLFNTDRIISVENLSLGGARTRNDETILTASFRASTFRLKDGSALYQGDPDAEEEPEESPPKRKSKVGEAREKREADVAERSGEDIKGSGGDEPAAATGTTGANRLTNPGVNP